MNECGVNQAVLNGRKEVYYLERNEGRKLVDSTLLKPKLRTCRAHQTTHCTTLLLHSCLLLSFCSIDEQTLEKIV